MNQADPSPGVRRDWTHSRIRPIVALLLLGLCIPALGYALSLGHPAAPHSPPTHTSPSARASPIRSDDPPPIPALIDLNTASADQLQLLPGIGPSKAAAIIDSRDSQGPFMSIDDLDRVKGIGLKTIERLRPLVKVTPAAPSP